MMSVHSRRILGLLALAFGLRAAYAMSLPNSLLFPDATSFDAIAWNIASTGHYSFDGQPTSVRPPGYVGFLAAVYKIGGHHYLAGRLSQAILGTLMVLLLMDIAKRLSWGSGVIWGVGWMTALYPFFIYYSAQVVAETFLTFSLVLCLLMTLRWQDRLTSIPRSGLCGLAFAILILTKSIFIPLFGAILLAETALSLRSAERARIWRAIAFAAGIFLIPILLWGARNQRVLGKFALDTHGGISLVYPIIFHQALKAGTLVQAWEFHPIRLKALTMSEADRDIYYIYEVKRYIAEHPGLYLKESLVRFKDFWRLYPRQDIDFLEGRQKLTVISLLTEPILVFVGLFGLFKTRGQWRGLYPAYVSIALLTVTHTLISGQMRYRLPIMPIMILLTSYVLFSPKNRSSDH